MFEEHATEILIFTLSIAFTAWAAVVKKSADRLVTELTSIRIDLRESEIRMQDYILQTERRLTRLENIAEYHHSKARGTT